MNIQEELKAARALARALTEQLDKIEASTREDGGPTVTDTKPRDEDYEAVARLRARRGRRR